MTLYYLHWYISPMNLKFQRIYFVARSQAVWIGQRYPIQCLH